MNNLVTPVVVNKYKEPFDVYIGRGSYWGNPYPINDAIGDTREVVINKYLHYLRDKYKTNPIEFVKELKALSGKRLGCFCKPKPCHGDVIVSVFNVFKDKG